MFSTPKLTKTQQENQLINCCIGNHDLLCHCKNPGYHTLWILTNKIGKELTPQEKQQLKQCLGEDHTTNAADGPEEDIGDLELLFAEDTTDAADG